MRIFTKAIVAMCCLAAATAAQAQDTEMALTADMFYNWDGDGANASATSSAQVDFNIGNDAEINAGGMVCGTGSVLYLVYADLTGSTKMVIEGTAGMQLRVLMNRQESNNGPLVERNPTIGDDGTAEVDLTDLAFVHLNAIKAGWGSAAGKISAIKLVKPADALGVPKEQLKKAIALGKMQSPVAKTEASFAALAQAIANGETALNAADATAESLEAATTAINNAIAALELQEGYANMTKDMFMTWESHTATEGTVNPACAYQLFEGSGLPYGLSTVDWQNFANLTDYDQLIITVADGTPRFCFNRLTAAGQDNDDESQSEMIDIPNNGRSTAAYQTTDETGKVFTINLKQMTADKGFAHLHCIKGANWQNVTITGMYLYKEKEIVEEPVVPHYGTIWGADEDKVFPEAETLETLELSTAYFKDFAQEKDILRFVIKSIGTTDEARAESQLRDMKKTGNISLFDANGELFNESGYMQDVETYDILISAEVLSKLTTGDKITIRGRNLTLDEIQLVENIDTGINLMSNDACQKDNAVYNLSGQRIQQATKGIYIVNGKKMILK